MILSRRRKQEGKGNNVSQLAIRNFNDITGKHVNTHGVFIFV